MTVWGTEFESRTLNIDVIRFDHSTMESVGKINIK